MFCKNCGAKIDNDSKFCINCGCEINTFVDKIESEIPNDSTIETPNIISSNVEDEDRYSNDVETANNIIETVSENEDVIEELEPDDDSDAIKDFAEPEENIDSANNSVNDEVKIEKPSAVVESYDNEFLSVNGQKKKIMIIAGVIIVSIIALVIIAIVSSGAAERKMNKALDTQSAYEVNSLYSKAYGDSKKLEKYDETISRFLDKVINNLNNIEYSNEDLAENGYTVVYRDLESDWGNLIYSEDGETIEPSISYYNQTSWDEIQNIIKSRVAYCSGVAYRDSYMKPKEAIDSFKQVTSEDSYYYKVDDEIVKCVDLYIEQTLAEAQELINKDDISGAVSKIDSINSYLENNGLTSNTVQEKLVETKNKYAESYVKKAEDCFKKRDVNGAIGNIEVAIELSPENVEYKAKKDTYEMYLPFYMYESDNILSTSSDRRIQTDDDIKAVNQKVYNNSLTYRYYQDCKDGTVKYLLEGKYDTVTGVYFSPKANASMNRTGTCYFVVYGDGKEIYKSKTISAESNPIDFSFPVKDIQNLEITFVGTGSSVWGVDAYSFGDYACIAELTAQKNFPDEKGE